MDKTTTEEFDKSQKEEKGYKSTNQGLEERKSDESVKSYDPYEHRNVLKPNSDFGSLAHLLKTSLGSGILAMPMAFKNGGLVFGMIGTILIGIVCTHCIHMLVHCSYVLCKRIRVPTLSYERTAEVAFETGPKGWRKFAKTARFIIMGELLSSFILGNTVYVVFIAQSLYQVIEFNYSSGIDLRFYILMIWLPLILMCLLRTLKSLVPFSIIANTFVVVSFAITLYYIFRNINPTDDVNLIATIDRLPLFLCTVIFAIEGIGTVLPIENEMLHPNHFLGCGRGRCGIVYISMSIVVSLYAIIGFFGYLQYGEATRGSITLNLPVKDIMAQAVKILIGLAIFFTYALQFYVPINIIYELLKLKTPEKYHEFLNYSVRIGLVTLTIIIAIVLPQLEAVISLVGSVCFSMLGLLFPAIIDTMTRWPNTGRWKWRLVKNVIIMFLSLLCLVSGTYATILGIQQAHSG